MNIEHKIVCVDDAPDYHSGIKTLVLDNVYTVSDPPRMCCSERVPVGVYLKEIQPAFSPRILCEACGKPCAHLVGYREKRFVPIKHRYAEQTEQDLARALEQMKHSLTQV